MGSCCGSRSINVDKQVLITNQKDIKNIEENNEVDCFVKENNDNEEEIKIYTIKETDIKINNNNVFIIKIVANYSRGDKYAINTLDDEYIKKEEEKGNYLGKNGESGKSTELLYKFRALKVGSTKIIFDKFFRKKLDDQIEFNITIE